MSLLRNDHRACDWEPADFCGHLAGIQSLHFGWRFEGREDRRDSLPFHCMGIILDTLVLASTGAGGLAGRYGDG